MRKQNGPMAGMEAFPVIGPKSLLISRRVRSLRHCNATSDTTPRESAQRRQDAFGVADFELAGCFDIERLDHAVVDHHRVALGTDSHATLRQILFQTECLSETRGSVGDH